MDIYLGQWVWVVLLLVEHEALGWEYVVWILSVVQGLVPAASQNLSRRSHPRITLEL